MRVSSPTELDAFLDRRKPIGNGATFKPGDIFGEWRLTALIGKGGNGEVYRVEHISLGTVAAIKILMKESAADHFRQEAQLLSGLKAECFPRFYSFGEAHGHLYYTLELLEPAPLPKKDSEIAAFLIAVARAVSELHWRELVHRDIKPQNILYRGKQPVLIDFGLVERIGTPISKGSGTPKYAAPEQFAGGEISIAIDIHALGVLANGCFEGHPPREWERIVNRSTSSIPARRYADAAEFIKAVEHRHLSKWLGRIATTLLIVGGIALYGYLWWNSGGEEKVRWRSLCQNITTNLVSQELIYVKYGTNKIGNVSMVMPVERGYRVVTNEVRETVINLAHGTHRFVRPIRLEPGNYRVIGPGVLNADIIGSSNVTMRLNSCVIQNQTETLPPENDIHYIVERGTYLNFAKIYKCEKIRENIEIPDGYAVEVRFRGPATLQELNDVRDAEWRRSLDDN